MPPNEILFQESETIPKETGQTSGTKNNDIQIMAPSIHFSSLTIPVPLRKPKTSQWRESRTSLLAFDSPDTNIDDIGFIGTGCRKQYKCKHQQPFRSSFLCLYYTVIVFTCKSLGRLGAHSSR